MPFKSKAQRRWMHANKPGMADRWEKETPSEAALPEHASKKGKIKKAYQSSGFPNSAGPEDWDAIGDSPWKQGEPKAKPDERPTHRDRTFTRHGGAYDLIDEVLRNKKAKISQGDEAYLDGDGSHLMPHLRAIHKLGAGSYPMDAEEMGEAADEQAAMDMAGLPASTQGRISPALARALFVMRPQQRVRQIQEALLEEELMRRALGKVGHVVPLEKLAISPELLDRAAQKAVERGAEAAYFADRGKDPTGEHAKAKAKSYAQADRFRSSARFKRLQQDAVKRHAAAQAEEAAGAAAEAAKSKVKAPFAKRVVKALKKAGPAAGAAAVLGGALYVRHKLRKRKQDGQKTPKEKTAQGEFEYADLGPNSGQSGYDPPRIWKMPKRAAGLDQEQNLDDPQRGTEPPAAFQQPDDIRLQQLARKQGPIKKIARASYVAFLDELDKLGHLVDHYARKEAP